jgi:hypothetical protein
MESIKEGQLLKFFKRRQEHLMMFSWVQSVKHNLPSVTVEKAIEQYLDFYNIDADIQYMAVNYHRMLKELKDAGI